MEILVRGEDLLFVMMIFRLKLLIIILLLLAGEMEIILGVKFVNVFMLILFLV